MKKNKDLIKIGNEHFNSHSFAKADHFANLLRKYCSFCLIIIVHPRMPKTTAASLGKVTFMLAIKYTLCHSSFIQLLLYLSIIDFNVKFSRNVNPTSFTSFRALIQGG